MLSEMRDMRAVRERWNLALCLYIPYVLLGAVIALAASDDGLGKSATLSLFVTTVSAVIPSIQSLANVSAFPEVVRIYGAVMWAVQPLITAAVIVVAPRIPVLRVSRVWLFLGFPAFVAVLIVLGIFLPAFWIEPSSADLSYVKGRGRVGLTIVVENRLGLATLGSLVMAVISFCQVIVIKSIPYYVRLLRLNLARTRPGVHG